jgi:hypothetical protein
LIAVTFIELLLILVEIQNLIGLADAPSHDSQALASGAADKHYAGLERKSNVEEAESLTLNNIRNYAGQAKLNSRM